VPAGTPVLASVGYPHTPSRAWSIGPAEFLVVPKQSRSAETGPVGVGVGVGVGDGVGLGVGDGVGDGDGLGLVVLGDGDGVVGDGLGLLLGDADGDWLGDPVTGSQSCVKPPLALVATRQLCVYCTAAIALLAP